MNELIAVIDDEQEILNIIETNLTEALYKTEVFSNSESFYDFLEEKLPDLIILDLYLKNEDGLDICKKLKSNSEYKHIPIIMVTSKSEESDRIVGLEFGADDYVTKPFFPKELAARVKAVLRRTGGKEEENPVIRIGDSLTMYTDKFMIEIEGNEVKLTSTEFKILNYLARYKGMVFSRAQILEHLWGNEKYVVEKSVDVHIKNLRKKLGDYGTYIENVRGFGYKVVKS